MKIENKTSQYRVQPQEPSTYDVTHELMLLFLPFLPFFAIELLTRRNG